MARPDSGVPSMFRRFAADRRGVAAVEAALTMPVFALLLIYTIQIYFYMSAVQRVNDAAQTTANSIAEQLKVTKQGVTGSTTAPSLSDIFGATKYMLMPYTTTTTNPAIDAASIVYAVPSSGVNNLTCGTSACTGIDWEESYQGAAKDASSTAVYSNFSTGCTVANPSACYCTLVPGSNPATCITGQSVIYVKVSYVYTTPIALAVFLGQTQTITATAFLKPRYKAYIQDCTGAGQTNCQ
jgi:Flp pilus assembly protein TadG